jgi:hypothetical protein
VDVCIHCVVLHRLSARTALPFTSEAWYTRCHGLWSGRTGLVGPLWTRGACDCVDNEAPLRGQ